MRAVFAPHSGAGRGSRPMSSERGSHPLSTTRPARSESAPLAGERHQPLEVTIVAAHPDNAVFQAASLRSGLEFPMNILPPSGRRTAAGHAWQCSSTIALGSSVHPTLDRAFTGPGIASDSGGEVARSSRHSWRTMRIAAGTWREQGSGTYRRKSVVVAFQFRRPDAQASVVDASGVVERV